MANYKTIQVVLEPELKEYIEMRARESEPPTTASAYILSRSKLRSEFRQWKQRQDVESRDPIHPDESY